MRNGRALGLYLVLAVVVIILDQLSKIWIVSAFELYQRVEILPFFNLVYVRNTGAAFSFLSDAGGWQRWFFTAIAVAVGVILVRWLKKVAGQQPVPAWGCALVLGGAIGNLIDRLQHGFVIDFLDVHAAGYHWPAFNIADSAICIGAALLILDGFVSGKRDAKARASSTKES